MTAYGPLGRPGLSEDPQNDPIITEDPVVKEMAAKYGRTIAQVLLRYLVISHIQYVKIHSRHVITRVQIIDNAKTCGDPQISEYIKDSGKHSFA